MRRAHGYHLLDSNIFIQFHPYTIFRVSCGNGFVYLVAMYEHKLCLLQCFGMGDSSHPYSAVSGVNLALNRPALASSQRLANEHSSRMVDGLIERQWASASTDAHPWAWVDLLGSYNVTAFELALNHQGNPSCPPQSYPPPRNKGLIRPY